MSRINYSAININNTRKELKIFKSKLSQNIKDLRSIQNVTHEEIEKNTGLSRSTIYRVENNAGEYKLENAFYIISAINFLACRNCNYISHMIILDLWDKCSVEEQEYLLSIFNRKFSS